MKELLASGDLVLMSALKHHLSEEGIEFDVFDGFTGSLFPGDLAIAPTRIMVDEDDFSRANWVLKRLKNGDMACE